jgi:hypothetical protein
MAAADEDQDAGSAEVGQAPRHGIVVPRGLDESPRGENALPQRTPRFGLMFDDPDLRRDPGADAIEQLAATMIRGAGATNPNGRIPAGYTYLGQFIDHDITFDPTSTLDQDNDPHALRNFRTPRFDLDSLYGAGPDDQPFLYESEAGPFRGVKLLLGENPAKDPANGEALAKVDLPRNQQGRALIGDPRNDENLITAQLHLLFIQFHNKVVDQLADDPGTLTGKDLLEEAQQTVRWHYQWIVMHDFVPKVVDADVLEAVFPRPVDGAKQTVDRTYFQFDGDPFMPVEFSVAAYRFGHSMVRDDYKLNDSGGVPIFRRSGVAGRHLGGLRRLPDSLRIEWARFFFPRTLMTPETANNQMESMLIDTSLASALSHVPPDGKALARLNLQRGRRLEVPAGPAVADKMSQPPLDEQALDLDGINDADARGKLVDGTPLWYYLLREAALLGAGGMHLGPVGSRIVVEVLAGLLEADTKSYLHADGSWTPHLGRTAGAFSMRDLIAFTLQD